MSIFSKALSPELQRTAQKIDSTFWPLCTFRYLYMQCYMHT